MLAWTHTHNTHTKLVIVHNWVVSQSAAIKFDAIKDDDDDTNHLKYQRSLKINRRPFGKLNAEAVALTKLSNSRDACIPWITLSSRTMSLSQSSWHIADVHLSTEPPCNPHPLGSISINQLFIWHFSIFNLIRRACNIRSILLRLAEAHKGRLICDSAPIPSSRLSHQPNDFSFYYYCTSLDARARIVLYLYGRRKVAADNNNNNNNNAGRKNTNLRLFIHCAGAFVCACTARRYFGAVFIAEAIDWLHRGRDDRGDGVS